MSAGLDRAGFVARDRIVARIASSGADVLAVVAGAGYGKTTLLVEVAEREQRPVAWVTLDVSDDDPTVGTSRASR